MTRLLCNGVALDLYNDAGLQFTHKNPLFAFDNLECERTTQFKLPCTPTNDALLSLARVPAYAGTGMRQRFTAQLQDGVTVKNGYLYVSNYDGKDYAAIFVTGELVGLQAIKNLGTLAEIMSFTEVETLGGASVSPAAATNDIWKNVLYKKPVGELLRPSIQLNELYNAVCTAHSITAQPLPASVAGVRIIPEKMNGADEQMPFTFKIIDTTQPQSTEPSTPYDALTYNATLFADEDTPYGVAQLQTGGTSPNKWYLIRQFKAKTNLKLKMPDNWPSNMYIYDLSETHQDPDTGNAFYGGRYFTKDMNQPVVAHGDPLKGREVEINAGECFCFVDSSHFLYQRQQIMGTWYYDYGFEFDDTDYTIQVTTTPENGDIVRLQDNLPDMTFTDLLKAVAALAGYVLNYTDADGLIFEPLVLSGYTQHVLKNITKRSEVQRTFSDYVQNNIVRFEGVPSRGQAIAYTIQNDNLDREKELQAIPFADGDSQDGLLFVPQDVDKPTVGYDGGDASLSAITLPKNAGVQTLCNASTQFKVEARMTMAEYNEITAKTLLLVDNTLYIWTDRSWQKNTAKFTLAKV